MEYYYEPNLPKSENLFVDDEGTLFYEFMNVTGVDGYDSNMPSISVLVFTLTLPE